MTVAVEKGLLNIKEGLEKMGYRVIYDEKNFRFADAYVFSGKNYSPLSQSAFRCENAGGVLMINAENKTAADIDVILKSRLYSPLF